MHPHNIYRMKLTFIGFRSDTGKDNNKNGYCVSLFFLILCPNSHTIFMGGFQRHLKDAVRGRFVFTAQIIILI